MICILFCSCHAKSHNQVDKTHIQKLAEEFMRNTVIPQMKDPKPYEITNTKVVIKRVADQINDYRFVYDHLSLSKADSLENKRHLDSIIKVSDHPDSIISVTVNVAYKTRYRLGDIVTDSIKFGYNRDKDQVSYFPF